MKRSYLIELMRKGDEEKLRMLQEITSDMAAQDIDRVVCFASGIQAARDSKSTAAKETA